MEKSKTELNVEKFNKANYFTRVSVVQNYLKEQDKSNKILEIGCGAGELSRDIKKMGFHNLRLADIGNFTDGLDVDLVDVSFEKLPFNNEKFDIVLAIAIAEHLENPFLFYRECARVVKKGGIFMIAIPHAISIKSRLNFLFSGNLIGYNKNNNHISFLPRDVFEKTVLDNFEIEDIFYSGGYIKILGKKIRFGGNKILGKLFGNKVLYILKRK